MKKIILLLSILALVSISFSQNTKNVLLANISETTLEESYADVGTSSDKSAVLASSSHKNKEASQAPKENLTLTIVFSILLLGCITFGARKIRNSVKRNE